MISLLRLAVSFGVCFAAAGLGSLATYPSIPTWYATLNKPGFTPPNWVFGPAWTLLYLLMAVAAWLVWQKIEEDRPAVRGALIAFGLQLLANVLWSVVFFGYHSPLAGYAVIILLWLLILWTMIRFFRISKIAGWLLVPYLLWVTFASGLNLAVVLLN